MTCVPGIKVFLNDVRIKIKNFKDYIDMYNSPPESALSSSDDVSSAATPKPVVVYERVSDRWELAVMASTDGQFHQISFVNAICTSKVGIDSLNVV
jgi:DNA topoisomerase-2